MNGIQDYWKENRLNYDKVVLANLTLQSSYMADVALSNANKLEDEHFNTEDFHYWAAFADIMQTLTEGCCSGHTVPKNLERARMRGMCDAFNVIIEGIKKGEFVNDP